MPTVMKECAQSICRRLTHAKNFRWHDAEGAIAGLLYFLDVNVDVPAAVVVLDETVPSLFVKPLHSPARHGRSPIFKPEQTARLIRRPDKAQLKRAPAARAG